MSLIVSKSFKMQNINKAKRRTRISARSNVNYADRVNYAAYLHSFEGDLILRVDETRRRGKPSVSRAPSEKINHLPPPPLRPESPASSVSFLSSHYSDDLSDGSPSPPCSPSTITIIATLAERSIGSPKHFANASSPCQLWCVPPLSIL